MTTREEKIDAIRSLPLRWDVKWIDLSAIFPGIIQESIKREELGRFGAVNLESKELAAEVVRLHNEELEKEKVNEQGK